MSLRLPSAAQQPMTPEPEAPPSEPASNAPLANPFAAGPGGFVVGDDLQPKGKRLSATSVLILLVIVGAALLFGMRKLGMGPKLDLMAIQIDYPLEGENKPQAKDHVVILDDLRTGGRANRVPLSMVQINPFSWRSLIPAEVETIDEREVDPTELARREQESRKKRIAEAAEKLVLNSVMAGRVPIARISGETVRVGDVLGETFHVKAITGRSVELEAEGQTFTLLMGEKPAP